MVVEIINKILIPFRGAPSYYRRGEYGRKKRIFLNGGSW